MLIARPALTLLWGAALALVVLASASAQPRAHAKYGGTLVVGSAEPEPLDPTLTRAVTAVAIERTFCEGLYRYDGKARLVPQLAAAMPVLSADKRTYTIPLRKGIVFNDGTPFNAQAVKTTIERDLTLPGSAQAGFLAPIDTVVAQTPYTVVITLKDRYSPLTDALTTTAGMVLSPTQLAKLGDNFASNPICVGPFMYDNRVAGDSVTVIKSPYYYDRGAVHLDKIVFKVVNDPAAAAAALKAGDLQVLQSVSPTELPAIHQSSRFRTIKRVLPGWSGIQINLGNRNGVGNLPYGGVSTPLALSPQLRQAFEEAIDRATLVRVALGGVGVPGCTPFSPASGWHDPGIRCTPYDPAHARRLVATSGFRNPTVHLLGSGLVAEFIQAQEAAVGINVVIDSFDQPTTISRRVAGNFDAALNGFPGTGDPDPSIYDWVVSTGVRNYSGYTNPRLDLILANSRKATTDTARRTLYHAAQQILAGDRPIIFLYHTVAYAAMSASVTGVEFAGSVLPSVAFAQFK